MTRRFIMPDQYCRGIQLPDGRFDTEGPKLHARDGIVTVDDRLGDALAPYFDSLHHAGFGHVMLQENDCPQCGFAAWPWQEDCPRCGSSIKEE